MQPRDCYRAQNFSVLGWYSGCAETPRRLGVLPGPQGGTGLRGYKVFPPEGKSIPPISAGGDARVQGAE